MVGDGSLRLIGPVVHIYVVKSSSRRGVDPWIGRRTALLHSIPSKDPCLFQISDPVTAAPEID